MGRPALSGLSVMKTKADRMWDEFGPTHAGNCYEMLHLQRLPSIRPLMS